MKKLYASALLALTLLSGAAMAQTPIFTETFGTTRVVPAGWVVTTPGWIVDSSATNNAPTPPYSGSIHINIRNEEPGTIPAGTYSIISPTINATGYENIAIKWAGRRTRNFAATQVMTLEVSTAGASGPWTAVTYTDRPADSQWGDVAPAPLGTAYDNAPSLTFRWTVTTIVSTGTYRIDDIVVEGDRVTSLPGKQQVAAQWLQRGEDLTVAVPQATQGEVVLYNAAGVKVGAAQLADQKATLNLSALPQGLYRALLITPAGVNVKALVR